MRDLALTSSHDLDVSAGDLSLIDGAAQVRQQILIKLKLWRGEWFLDTEFGTPYIEQILGKQLTLSGALAALRASVLEIDAVRQITAFTYEFSNSTRKLSVAFTADTSEGLVEVTA